MLQTSFGILVLPDGDWLYVIYLKNRNTTIRLIRTTRKTSATNHCIHHCYPFSKYWKPTNYQPPTYPTQLSRDDPNPSGCYK